MSYLRYVRSRCVGSLDEARATTYQKTSFRRFVFFVFFILLISIFFGGPPLNVGRPSLELEIVGGRREPGIVLTIRSIPGENASGIAADRIASRRSPGGSRELRLTND